MLIKSGALIDLKGIPIESIPILTDTLAQDVLKGWNLPNIWDLLALKQVYLEIDNSNIKTRSQIHKNLPYLLNKSNEKREGRLVDEYLNALECFDLIVYEQPHFRLKKTEVFDSSNPTTLTFHDQEALRDIFYSYYRFKEIANWFLQTSHVSEKILATITRETITNVSTPIFYTSLHEIKTKDGKLRKSYDSFFYSPIPTKIMQIDITNEKIMRFWDVFLNWGKELGQIQKINLGEVINTYCRCKVQANLNIAYFINDVIEFDIEEFIKTNYPKNTRIISLPELTVNLGYTYRCSISKIHQEIIKQTSKKPGVFSLQRTSEIFIARKEYIYPKLRNTYMSHIIIR